MIDLIIIAISSVMVIWLIHLFKLIPLCKDVLATAGSANAIGRNDSLSMLEKEQQTQQAAKQLLGQFGKVFIRGIAAFALPVLPVYLLSIAGLVELDNIIAMMSSIEFILAFCVIFLLSLVKGRK